MNFFHSSLYGAMVLICDASSVDDLGMFSTIMKVGRDL